MGRRRKEESDSLEQPSESFEQPSESLDTEEVSPSGADTPQEMDITDKMRELLKGRIKTLVPTLVEYKPAGSVGYKYVIVDIDHEGMRDAWALYKAQMPEGNSEDFLVRIYAITRQDIPRMYRAVMPVSLN